MGTVTQGHKITHTNTNPTAHISRGINTAKQKANPLHTPRFPNAVVFAPDTGAEQNAGEDAAEGSGPEVAVAEGEAAEED